MSYICDATFLTVVIAYWNLCRMKKKICCSYWRHVTMPWFSSVSWREKM